MVKYMKKNPVIANKCCQSLGPSLYRGFTVYGKPIALTTGQIFFQRIALSTFQTIGASTTIILAERGYILTFVRQEYRMIIKVPAG